MKNNEQKFKSYVFIDEINNKDITIDDAIINYHLVAKNHEKLINIFMDISGFNFEKAREIYINEVLDGETMLNDDRNLSYWMMLFKYHEKYSKVVSA